MMIDEIRLDTTNHVIPIRRLIFCYHRTIAIFNHKVTESFPNINLFAFVNIWSVGNQSQKIKEFFEICYSVIDFTFWMDTIWKVIDEYESWKGQIKQEEKLA